MCTFILVEGAHEYNRIIDSRSSLIAGELCDTLNQLWINIQQEILGLSSADLD